MSLLPLWLRLFVASVLPYLRGLESWIRNGRMHDAAGELLLVADGSIPLSDAAAHWKYGHVLRPEEAIPSLFLPLAPQILVTGKSRHLLSRMQISSLGTAPPLSPPLTAAATAATAAQLKPLDASFCDRLTALLRHVPPTPIGTAPADPPPRPPIYWSLIFCALGWEEGGMG